MSVEKVKGTSLRVEDFRATEGNLTQVCAMQRKVHGFTLKSEDVLIWQQVHAPSHMSFLVHRLDILQDTHFLIVSIVDEYTKALTALSVLTVSAILVSVDEG